MRFFLQQCLRIFANFLNFISNEAKYVYHKDIAVLGQ